MASRMIHYTIGKLISHGIDIKDSNQFIIGGLAPDMVSTVVNRTAKKQAHFFEKHHDINRKGYNWTTFYHKYLKENINNEFILGYFVHLICDNIWVTDIQLKYTFADGHKDYTERIRKGYDDMMICNYFIAKNYNLTYDIQPLKSFPIDEIQIAEQEKFLNELEQDFLPYVDNIDLQVHNWMAILSYIDKCVEVCVKEIKNVMNYTEPTSPFPYMTVITP